MKPIWIVAGVLVVAALVFSGCTATQGTGQATRSYSVNSSGILSLEVPPATVSENILESPSNITVSRLVFHTPDGDVYGLLAAPPAAEGRICSCTGCRQNKGRA